jgi:hypothetical protein
MGQINSNTNQYYIGTTFLEATPRTDKNGRTKSYCQMHTLFILFLIIDIDFLLCLIICLIQNIYLNI